MRTVLAIGDHPVLAEILLHSDQQYIAAISALQEVLPLLTATGIVIPQSLHPVLRLWQVYFALLCVTFVTFFFTLFFHALLGLTVLWSMVCLSAQDAEGEAAHRTHRCVAGLNDG